jgi:hypothetical protein
MAVGSVLLARVDFLDLSLVVLAAEPHTLGRVGAVFRRRRRLSTPGLRTVVGTSHVSSRTRRSRVHA